MAKWINKDTNDIGTFNAEKRGNKNDESNQTLRISAKTKMCCLFLFFLIKRLIRAKH